MHRPPRFTAACLADRVPIDHAAVSVYAFAQWEGSAFGPRRPQKLMRIVVPSLTALIAGIENRLHIVLRRSAAIEGRTRRRCGSER